MILKILITIKIKMNKVKIVRTEKNRVIFDALLNYL
jgi:hypothetical protein